MRLIDVSHTVEDGVITYKGLPAPIICDYLSREASAKVYSPGTSFQIGKIEMCSNTGTYIDSPFHRYEDGKDLSEIDLASVASIPAVKVTVSEQAMSIDESTFAGLDVNGKAVLIETNWSRHWNTDNYFENHPFLTAGAANWLKEHGAVLVGIDSHNIDDTRGNERPVHTILLGNDILIVEHLCNLDALPEDDFRFYAVPVKVKGFGTFPVRAFGQVE